MRGTTPTAIAAVAVVIATAAGCTATPTNPPKETTVLNDLTQKEATAGADQYVRLVATQLPPESRLVPLGTGTVNCHTADGEERTGQVFVAARHSVEGVDPARYLSMIDQMRETWRNSAYRIIDDIHYQDKDRTVRVATPGDDYHLTLRTYGDNRSTPLLLIESPCAWPDSAPTTRTSG